MSAQLHLLSPLYFLSGPVQTQHFLNIVRVHLQPVKPFWRDWEEARQHIGYSQ